MVDGRTRRINDTNEPTAPVVLAVAPPGTEDVLDAPTFLGRMPNVGILYLASALERGGYPCLALDRHYDACSPFEFAAEILSYSPRAIGFTLFDLTMEFTKETLAIIRHLYDGPIIVGGYTATFHAEDILRMWSEVDYVLTHEAEDSLIALIRHLDGQGTLEEVPNLYWRELGTIRHTRPAPLIDVSIIAWPKRNWNEAQDVTPIITRRGCTSRCSFCSMVPFYDLDQGPIVRFREVVDVVDEIEHCIDHGRREFMFYDDDFGLVTKRDRTWSDRFVDEIRRRRLRFQFGVELRVIDITHGESQLEALCDAGMSHMAIGMESLLPRQLELFKKGYKQEQVYAAIEIARRIPVYYQTNVIFWDPWSTLAEAKKHLELLDGIDFQDQLASANYPFYAATLSARQGTSVHLRLTEARLLRRSPQAFYRYGFEFQDSETAAFHRYCLPDFLNRSRNVITRPPTLWMLVPRLRFAGYGELADKFENAGNALARMEFEYFRRYVELAIAEGFQNPNSGPYQSLHTEMAERLAVCASAFPSVSEAIYTELYNGTLPNQTSVN